MRCRIPACSAHLRKHALIVPRATGIPVKFPAFTLRGNDGG
jgi:hypothetical protein